MKIFIDATSLLLPSAGVKNYVYFWLQALERAASPGLISAFPFLEPEAPLDHQKSPLGAAATLARLMLVRFANLRGNHILDVVCAEADIFHASQHVFNPPRRAALTATVFDMTCWILPETHTPANVAATKKYAEQILRRAGGLIAISASTRDDLAAILNIPAATVEVIYPGVAEHFFHADPGAEKALRQKYDLSRPYLLFVGCLEPRKNIPAILDAYRMLPESLQRDCELVLAGPAGWGMDQVLERLKRERNVRALGYVPEIDLPPLLRGAEALVYPSLYEGFGLPVAEAMAAGVPVITSNVSSLPEIAGDCALLVNPRDSAELSAAMERLLSSQSLREQLGAAGRVRAERYHWEACADASLQFFARFGGFTAPGLR